MTAANATAASAAASRLMIADRLAAAERIVVKVGTNVLVQDSGLVALAPLYSLIDSVATMRRAGRDVLVVSSGAVGLGAERLALAGRPSTLAMRQACAAVGQSRLISIYEDGFARLGLATAQVLVTDDDLADRHRRRNLGAAVEALFRANVIPILNENDTVSTPGIELEHGGAAGTPAHARLFSDNDMLAALMATTVRASVLLLLTDVDGLYTADPSLAAGATLVPVVPAITPDVAAAAGGGGARGRGGMAGKLAAARVATQEGVLTIIANGRRPNIIDDLWAGAAGGTFILPAS